MRAAFIQFLERERIKRCVITFLLVCAAGVLTLAARPFFDGKAPLLFFTLAVLLTAGYGGTVQGVLATGLSIGAALLLFRDHLVVLVLAYSSLTLFGVVGVAASLVLGKLLQANAALSKANVALSQARDELRMSNEDLVDHAEALARSNAELERFAYAVAHDLNAPLRMISTRTALCLEQSKGALPAESRASLATVLSSARSMSRLIENLLTLARVGQDRANALTVVDAGDVAKLALQYLQQEIIASGARIKLSPLPTVLANDGQFLRLLQNLVSNALKYRGEHSPEIQLTATREEDMWCFTVSDDGIGIDPRYHSTIFEPFHRLHSAAEYDGSGVGLAICKRIVEQHGGRIWVESTDGKGARFSFTLQAPMDVAPLKRSADAGTGL